VLSLCESTKELKQNLSVAAHLIHGSSDDRFSITYAAALLTQEEVESVYFTYMKYEDACQKYDPETLIDGYNVLADGEEIFFIRNPALGLWAVRSMI
jgi:hypothetical protein